MESVPHLSRWWVHMAHTIHALHSFTGTASMHETHGLWKPLFGARFFRGVWPPSKPSLGFLPTPNNRHQLEGEGYNREHRGLHVCHTSIMVLDDMRLKIGPSLALLSSWLPQAACCDAEDHGEGLLTAMEKLCSFLSM